MAGIADSTSDETEAAEPPLRIGSSRQMPTEQSGNSPIRSADVDKEEVKTGADRLLELVKKSREIAMAAAAKELGVPIQTVDAWANFLEEDGLVMVKYKFTTPYIAVPEAQAGRGKKEEKLVSLAENADFHNTKAEIEDVQAILSKASEERASGEFGLLKQTYSALAAKLRAIHEQLTAEAEVTPQKKAMLNDSLMALEEGLQEAASRAVSGKFDEASAAYSKLYAQATSLYNELKRLYEQVATLRAIQSTEDYKDLLGKAYQLMSEGRIEEAAELYDKLKFAHANLAREFIEKKKQMEEDLVKFNKDLSKNVDGLNTQKLKEVMRRINVLLSAGRQFLKKGEFDTSESYYLAIRHEYGTLPLGFSEEKKEIQQNVLGFYSALARQREKAIKKKFDILTRQIELVAKQAQESLNELNVEQAVRMYGQIKQLYNMMPAGFLKDKAELQQRITTLYTALTSMYTQKSLSKLKSMSAEILTLIGIMSEHTEKGDLREAEEAYERIRRLYREMPKGFLHEETTLQNQIVNAYEAYLKRTKEMEGSHSASAIANITKLLGEAEQQMKKNNYSSANEAYARIMSVYNTLPAGFITQRASVRDRILRLYKAVLANANSEKPVKSGTAVTEMPVLPLLPQLPELGDKPANPAAIEEGVEESSITQALDVPQEMAEGGADYGSQTYAVDEKDIKKIDSEIDDVERKIEELKGLSRATVKPLQQ